MFALSGDQIVEIIKSLPALLLALGSLIAALRANKRAAAAEASAAQAHEKATEATREQLTFALRRAVRDAKAQGVSVVVPDLGNACISGFQTSEPPLEVGATHE